MLQNTDLCFLLRNIGYVKKTQKLLNKIVYHFYIFSATASAVRGKAKKNVLSNRSNRFHRNIKYNLIL